MKFVQITLLLISLLALAQASTCHPQFTCQGVSDPSCQAELAMTNKCISDNCDMTSIQEGNFELIFTCFQRCQIIYQPFLEQLEQFVECIAKNDPLLQQMVLCALPELQQLTDQWQPAFLSQAQCLSSKCAQALQDLTNYAAIEKCVFQTCKSNSSNLNKVEGKLYECLTGKKVSVSAKILAVSVTALIGFLIQF